MTTLRDRLATKGRRRIVQPVQVEAASPEELALTAEWIADVAQGLAEPDQMPEALTALREARVVDVPFTAMPSGQWEKVVAVHPSPEGADGGMDWRAALPVVAALCCEDESMQDDDVWRDVLEGAVDDDGNRPGVWSHGELIGLWGALLALNSDHPAAHLPKG